MLAPLVRFLALLALAIQVAIGPACLALDVCHGSVQLPAADGASCCHESEHCTAAEESKDDGHTVASSSECADCFDIELAASNEPIDAPGSFELVAPTIFIAQVVHAPLHKPHGACMTPCDARAPPGAATPTGLLPGVFPLRI